MFPFKKILCPTDFSEPSLCTLKMAKEMTEKFDSDILVLNVHRPIPHMPAPRVDAPDVTFDISGYEEQVRKETEAHLADVVRPILGEAAHVHLLVRMGRPAKQILKCAEEEKVDAIFIATHGRTGLSHMVFGSVAEMVVRYAQCPILTIRSCD